LWSSSVRQDRFDAKHQPGRLIDLSSYRRE
jgi:hypothetical protein